MNKLNFSLIALAAALFVGCYDGGRGWRSNFEGGNKFENYGENPFVYTVNNSISTFSVDADGASYSFMRRYVNLGQLPPQASVRIEEYLNYFTFDYPEPVGDENIAINSEISTCPWTPNHHLLRLGIKGKTIPENELPSSNFVLLIDVSGSMSPKDRLDLLKIGFKQFVDQMRPTDRVAIVTYAGRVEVLLNSTPGDRKTEIKKAIDKLVAKGSTNGGDAIQKAYEIAEKNFIPGGNNRIILGTDGDFNVGITNKDDLVKFVKGKRETGVFLTVLGVGDGNLNDAMMKQLAVNGNGTYQYIDNVKQIMKVFVHEKSKFYTVARNSKIQITFNPEKVKKYRLIGYETRTMSNDDFDDDDAHAGEIGVGQTITAIYELVLHEDAPSEISIGTFDFRYIKPHETESRLLKHTIGSSVTQISQASENMRFAAAVTCFGLQMKRSQYKGNASKSMVLDLGNNAISFDHHGFRREFLELVRNVNF